MELVVDPLGQCPADAVNFCEISDASLPDSLEPAELPQKSTSPLGAQPGNCFQARRNRCSGPALPVPSDRKPVGLIPDLLDQQECGRVRR